MPISDTLRRRRCGKLLLLLLLLLPLLPAQYCGGAGAAQAR
jgi:hypothetical protein